jgi:hypothetical protein
MFPARREKPPPRPGYSNTKEIAMRYTMTIKKARKLEAGVYVLTPQHPTGVLLVHTIVEVETIDGGKYIEATTEDERKHVLNADDEVLVVLRSTHAQHPVRRTRIVR